jgi:hypothetical protein
MAVYFFLVSTFFIGFPQQITSQAAQPHAVSTIKTMPVLTLVLVTFLYHLLSSYPIYYENYPLVKYKGIQLLKHDSRA